MTWNILQGDCVEAMQAMEPASADAIVTDPPYGLGFMGREWDYLPPGLEVAREFLRVLKPGGHLLAFGGTRTYHRLVCALEDAGFEIRDCLAWLYGSGFPKSLDVSKAIDNRNGAKRERQEPQRRVNPSNAIHQSGFGVDGWAPTVREAVTEDAQRWEGWGTALKPAHEPIVLARKPLAGTVAANVLEHGTGGLNVDGCRIGTGTDKGVWPITERRHADVTYTLAPTETDSSVGRWPANVVLDGEAAAMLDEQTGDVSVNGPSRYLGDTVVGINAPGRKKGSERGGFGDSGGASRFFYVAKASRAERNAGLEGFEERDATERHAYSGLPDQRMEREQARNGSRNHHPTVKPVSLMRWLVRLVTPPGGLVLDPFAGSGTTGVAAVLEGFRFLGIEREPEYVQLARARIGWWLEHGEEALRIVREREARDAERAATLESGQLELGVG